MLDQSTIDRIIDAANIVDVVSEYVTLRRSGASYKGLCPFHDDKTPSFYVSPAKGLCKCFSCGKGGNAVHFIMEQEQLGYYDALKFLAKKYGIEVVERELTDAEKQSQSERESMFAVNEWASNYFHSTMLNHEDGRVVGLAYFRSRGFRDDIIEKFRLGYCLPLPDAMFREARQKGYKEDFLIRTGLCYKRDDGTVRDRYRDRAMFPWFSVSGKIVAFGGRVLDARTKGVNQKYINSPESDIFRKGRELYGIFQAKKAIAKEDCVYMVEGYTDVISMHQCGVENVVANSGTALNEAQIKILHRFTSNITLLYDGDNAGIHAALRGTDMLLAEGMNVKILLLPDGDDPDSFARKHNAAEFKEYVAANQTDFIIFKTNLLMDDAGRDPIKRSQLIQDIIKSISVIPEEIVRSTYLHECSEILGVDEQLLLRETAKMRKAERERIFKEKEREKERAKNLAANNAASQSVSTDSEINIPPPPMDYDDEGNPIFPEEQQQPAPEIHFTTRQSKEAERFIGLERMIMSVVARYGEQRIVLQGEDGDDVEISVAEYVSSELHNDELMFRSPLYARMLEEVVRHVSDSDFVAGRFLLNSPDIEMSREAVELLSERYRLSKGQVMQSEDETMAVTVGHLMIDYKYAVVEDEIRRLGAALSDPAVIGDIHKCQTVLQQYATLSDVQRKLAKQLGERVIIK